MTTKIKWRMSKLPTPQEIRELVNDKILTNVEAREILISQETEGERDSDSLKEEIKFLRELVQKLSNGNNYTIVKEIEYFREPYWRSDWFKPYWAYYSTGTTDQLTTGNGSSITTYASAIGGSSGGDLTIGTDTSSTLIPDYDFTKIETF